MFNDVIMLVHLKHLDNVFDEKESVESMSIVGLFEDKATAVQFRDILADTPAVGHGDRLVIFSAMPHQMFAESDIMTVLYRDVN